MPPFGPIGRRDLIAAFRRLGFGGPFAGARHQLMLAPDGRKLVVPNPHRGDIRPHLLAKLLREAGVSRNDWESA